jgi:hypothetical protein
MITDFEQRWNNKKPVFIPPTNCVDVRTLEVAEIPEADAKAFVERHHYSRSFPVSRRRFGLFQSGELVGVAVFSVPGSNLTITNVFGCENATDGFDLGRLIILDENPRTGQNLGFNCESFFSARCFKVLKKEGYVGTVMMSDDVKRTNLAGQTVFNGHLGTTYASLQCAFLGRATSRTLRILPDGTVFSEIAMSKIRRGVKGWKYASRILESLGADACPDDHEYRRLWLDLWKEKLTRPLAHPGNLKFALSFTKSVRLKSLPYPRFKYADLQRSLCLT